MFVYNIILKSLSACQHTTVQQNRSAKSTRGPTALRHFSALYKPIIYDNNNNVCVGIPI